MFLQRSQSLLKARPWVSLARFNSSFKDSGKETARKIHDEADKALQEATAKGAKAIHNQFAQEQGINSDIINKYKDKLTQKAQELGITNLDELKDKYKEQIEKVKSELGGIDINAEIRKWESQKKKEESDGSVINVRSRDPGAEKKPYKTLNDYVDVEKVRRLPRDDIKLIWKTRFQDDPRSLHATINNQQFDEITENASKYPYFLLPLPKSDDKDTHKGYQLEFVQWSFVGADTIHCLFTSLAEYKLHGEFAKPHVVLTFHQDLKKDKDLVLMNGLSEKDGGLSTQEAQLLVLNLQRFYNGKDSNKLALVKEFNEGSEKFTLDGLIKETTTI
ncbi:uncharacterized protein LODBEIA_P58090 [Lodderomyces beijingensis]|uniref:Protein ATP11, mitochondrial n=1 Tax=Lodderomyces beijingensis TaxID=1775926 RepID=A0ABP0ZVU1_9ASCO